LGTFVVRFAKCFGANIAAVCSVNAVCGTIKMDMVKMEMVRLLGADPMIDCTQQDFTQRREPCRRVRLPRMII
jgi:hypothetical protein